MAATKVQSPVTTGAISETLLQTLQAAFQSEPSFRQAMNSVSSMPLGKAALNRRRAAQVEHTFSVHLLENKATAQMNSGRCWMFAALNTFRVTAIKNMNLGDDFELSQNYTLFWDKLEKANYFLENILGTLDEPVGSRLLNHLLTDPIQDGGQWHMFVNLVQKYGVVPKTVMAETESSSATGPLCNLLTGKLREYACTLRKGYSASSNGSGKNLDKLRVLKEEMMAEVYRILSIHLGEPPTEFQWQWRDKDKTFHRDGLITPQEFYKRHVGLDLAEYVCLIHDPRPMHRYDEVYTVKLLGNVVGGEPVVYLNVDLDTIKRAAVAQLKDGEPVWFGCDVGKYLERDLGMMDLEIYDYPLLYGFKPGTLSPNIDKGERLMYGHSQMTHAMVFTGVDLDPNDKPRKWRVENSWSDKPGDKGFFQMSDAWFDEFNYEVVVRRSHVPASSLKALERKPVELDPWDPMGSLA